MTLYKILAQNFDLIDENNTQGITGKITCEHVFRANASGVLIGHPEINDSLESINMKIKKIISLQKIHSNALPYNVIMLGESLEEFSNNTLLEIAQMIEDQCSKVFKDIPDDFIKRTLLIYEPKWAGDSLESNGQLPPSIKLITRVTNKMRDFLNERLGPTGLKVSLMYGEITSPERAVEILSNENLQGLMLGSVCSTVEQILEIVKALQYAFDKRKIILVCNFKSLDLTEKYQDYLSALAIVPDNFSIYFAPPVTDIRYLIDLVKK
ncbi:MAG: triose-phosphate isomerase [Candidatus Thorarchaeota archaeon]